jgi:hypothetical protein
LDLNTDAENISVPIALIEEVDAFGSSLGHSFCGLHINSAAEHISMGPFVATPSAAIFMDRSAAIYYTLVSV